MTVVSGDTVRLENLDTVNRQIVANNGRVRLAGDPRPERGLCAADEHAGHVPVSRCSEADAEGTVEVPRAAPSVVAGVTPPIVTAGNAVHISGAISPAAVGTRS